MHKPAHIHQVRPPGSIYSGPLLRHNKMKQELQHPPQLMTTEFIKFHLRPYWFKMWTKGSVNLQSFCDPRAISKNITERKNKATSVTELIADSCIRSYAWKTHGQGSLHLKRYHSDLRKLPPTAFSISEAINLASNQESGGKEGLGMKSQVLILFPGWRWMQAIKQIITILEWKCGLVLV